MASLCNFLMEFPVGSMTIVKRARAILFGFRFLREGNGGVIK